MVKLILEGAGFGVLSATSANEAGLIAEGFPRAIHLLLSDVMMPDVSGPELASALKENRPEMRVMLMSGFADGAMLILNPAQSRLALHREAVSRFCIARAGKRCVAQRCARARHGPFRYATVA